MPKLKVLPLSESPVSVYARYLEADLMELEELLGFYTEIPASIRREGWYCRGKTSWVELAGKAYTDKHMFEAFEYKLSRLNFQPLSLRAEKALYDIACLNLSPTLSQEARNLLHLQREWRESRESELDTYRFYKHLEPSSVST